METRIDDRTQRSESQLIVDAARRVLERQGRARFRIHDVLREAGVGTRALYRHFASKEALVLAVFVEAAQEEAYRLRSRMAGASDPLEAVRAWIEARLELASDEQTAASLRAVSLEAQQASSESPRQMELALDHILEPLVEQLTRGQAEGLVAAGDPVGQALSIQDVVWGATLRQWSGIRSDDVTSHLDVIRFCLRGVGAVV